MTDWTRELALLHGAGVSLEPGLTEPELAAAEQACQAPFPPDLRELLAAALPSGERFPDWRDPESPKIQRALDWPFDGIAFDIEHGNFWWRDWGTRPPILASRADTWPPRRG